MGRVCSATFVLQRCGTSGWKSRRVTERTLRYGTAEAWRGTSDAINSKFCRFCGKAASKKLPKAKDARGATRLGVPSPTRRQGIAQFSVFAKTADIDSPLRQAPQHPPTGGSAVAADDQLPLAHLGALVQTLPQTADGLHAGQRKQALFPLFAILLPSPLGSVLFGLAGGRSDIEAQW